MTDWLVFEGRIEPLVWGKAAYAILRLPEPVAAAPAAAGARRVGGEINEHKVNLAVTRAPVVEGSFRWAGQSLLDRIGTRPGEGLDIRLRPAPDDRVDLPDDLGDAPAAYGLTGSWEALTPGKRRGMIYHIDTARRPQRRGKRIADLVGKLMDESPA